MEPQPHATESASNRRTFDIDEVAMSAVGGADSALSSHADEVPVIALVSDVDAWENLSEDRIGARIGQVAPGGTAVVTGCIG